MSESWRVILKEASDLNREISDFFANLEDSSANLSGSIDKFCALGTFTGQAALSAKSYFSEVHGALIRCFTDAALQLETAYAAGYFEKLPEASGGSWDARWEYDKMREADTDNVKFYGRYLDDVQQALRDSAAIASEVAAFSFPTTSYDMDLLRRRADNVEEVRNKVSDAEESGLEVLGAGSDYESLIDRMRDVLASCARGEVALGGYVSGSFAASSVGASLAEIVTRCEKYQTENIEQVMAAQQDSAAIDEGALKAEEEKALQERQAWAVVGLAAELVGTVAFVATTAAALAAGPIGWAAVAAAGVSAVGKGISLGERINQVTSSYKDPGKSAVAKDVKDGLGIAKDGLERIDDVEKVKRGFNAKDVKAGDELAGDGLNGAISFVGGEVIEYFVKENAGNYTDDAGAELVSSVTREAFDFGIDILVDGASKANPVAFGSNAVTSVATSFADYNIEKSEEKLSDIAEQRNRSEGRKTAFSSALNGHLSANAA